MGRCNGVVQTAVHWGLRKTFLNWPHFFCFFLQLVLEDTALKLYVKVRFEDPQAASMGFLWATSGNVAVQRRAALPPFLIRFLNPLPPFLLSLLPLSLNLRLPWLEFLDISD